MSRRLRIGFLGLGWIGRHRMDAMLSGGGIEAAILVDPSSECIEAARALAPDAQVVAGLEEMLDLVPEGVVIATPSALHAEQCIQALEAGAAVFCQKPLGRTAAEVEAVLDAARRADRLLGVDLSYRRTAAVQAIREQLQAGALGRIFAADLVFHNAHGPGNAWFWDPKLSGGGCLIDLGSHLVDLALWLMDFPELVRAKGRVFRDGRPPRSDEVEDYALGTLDLANGASVRIACSWNRSVGSDAVIRASFHGTGGSAELRNENGSFFDFTAELFERRERRTLESPPDDWGGRAGADWVAKLAAGAGFDQSTSGLLESARALDALYGRSAVAGSSAAPQLASVG